MNRRLCILPVLFAALVVGCAAKPEPAPVPLPPTADEAAALKAAILEVSPGAKVGTITTVITETPMAMVSGVDVAGVRNGDIFSVVDGTNNVVANASVEQVVDGKIAVRYTPVVRQPMVGDLAVKF